MGFVFYDVETTGTDRRYDQVLQFAAVATDDWLNERGSIDVECRLLPHVVPSPGALLATGRHIRSLVDASLPSHYEMMREVARTLEGWSPSVFAGWNSLRFDEEMLRQALFQSLHPPYLTAWHGNGRMDVMRVARAAALLTPGALVVPTTAAGRPTFALEAIARANGVEHGAPHRALSDARATFGMARLIEERSPEAWSAAARFCRKAPVVEFLGDGSPVALVDADAGEPTVLPIVVLGVDPGRANAMLVQDLRHDPADAQRLMDEPRPAWRLPAHVRRVPTNGCPIMLGLDDLEWPSDWLDESVVRSRADAVLADRAGVGATLRVLAWTPPPPSAIVERSLHGDFYKAADLDRLARFHEATWEERAAAIGSFDDWRLRHLSRRLVFHHAPELLGADMRERLERRSAARLRDDPPGGPEWLTLNRAREQASAMPAAAGKHQAILSDYVAWLDGIGEAEDR